MAIIWCSCGGRPGSTSGAGSTMPAAPGIAMRAWTKRSRRSAGLPASRPMAGSSRRSPPNRSSSRCGRSAMPLRSRSSWLRRPTGCRGRPAAHWFERLSPVVSTGWMLPVKRFPAKTLASELSLTRMPTWLPATRLPSTRLAWPLSRNRPSVLPAISLAEISRVVDRLQQQAVGAMAAVGDEAVARPASGPSRTSAPRRRRCREKTLPSNRFSSEYM